MSISTVLSLFLGVVCVIVSIYMGGGLGAFIDGPSVFIVVGGVVCSTVASFSPERMKRLMKALKVAFKKQQVDLSKDIDLIVDIANNARRNGLLALEEMAEDMNEPFLKKGILLVVDGYDQELLRSIMEAELSITKQRHSENRAILEAAAAYSPAFGMIGTLIGLINMLKNLEDMETLGPSMSVALVTTFYGSILANQVFMPLARRLKALGDVEYLRKELILEGIMAVQNGENPRSIREKLNAFLSDAELAVLEKAAKAKEAALESEEA
jgi:chemotaxis protein MotA